MLEKQRSLQTKLQLDIRILIFLLCPVLIRTNECWKENGKKKKSHYLRSFFLFCFAWKWLFRFETLQEKNCFTNYSTFLLHRQIQEITVACWITPYENNVQRRHPVLIKYSSAWLLCAFNREWRKTVWNTLSVTL